MQMGKTSNKITFTESTEATEGKKENGHIKNDKDTQVREYFRGICVLNNS